MRPADLARRHGLSTQAVRNYEDAGIIPPAHRSRTGYRDYTAAHAAGLAAYLALVPAFGHSTSRRIMHAVTGGQPGEALEYVDDGHSLLARDRNTLRTVEAALSHLGASTPNAAASTRTPYSIGELARHLALNRWPGPWKGGGTTSRPAECGTAEAPPPHGTRAHVQTFVLALRLTHSRLFIEVYDEDRAPPVMKRVSDASESGRGLHLVQALSRRWGYYHPTPESGKVVWCELPLVSADDGQAAAVQRVPHARSGPQVGS
jgi:hypothetical protein